MYSFPSFIAPGLFESIVDRVYDLILHDDYTIADVNVNLIDSLIPEYYDEEWEKISDKQRYDLIQYVIDQVFEFFDSD